MEPGGPDPEVEDKVMLKRHRVSRIYWNRHFFDYPISLSANTLKAMGPKLTLVAGFSYLKSMVHKLPEDNLENFYINRFGRKLYSMFFEGTPRSCGVAIRPRFPPIGVRSASRA